MLQPFSVETCLRAENVYYSGMKFYLTVIALCAHDDQDDRDDKNQDNEDDNNGDEKRNNIKGFLEVEGNLLQLVTGDHYNCKV